MKSVIFVCLGNICRSPIAHGCAIEYVKTNNLNIKVDSAGTSNYHLGEHPCKNSIKVCKTHNIDISMLKSTQITKQDLENFELVVALDDKNFKDLQNLGVTRLVKLGDYGLNSKDIPDPYFFNGYDGFNKVYEMIESCIINLFENYTDKR